MKFLFWTLPFILAVSIASGLAPGLASDALAASRNVLPEFDLCTPESDYPSSLTDGNGKPITDANLPSRSFCAYWNPEFVFNGHRCCSKVMRAKVRRRRKPKVCPQSRFKPNYCGEMTEDQREYVEQVTGGKVRDVLAQITQDLGRHGDQAYCTVNNGFLVHGRPLLPGPHNRVQLRAPDRCTNFGTDPMVGMIEWLGRQVDQSYSESSGQGVRLLVGDITSPRGGCLAGRVTLRGHASHTNGQDADIGFLTVKPGKPSPSAFHNDFDPKTNWPFIKKLMTNPFACVRVVFLDRRHISKLAKYLRKYPEEEESWRMFGRFLRHMPSHRNHMHVRIGDGPGQPGCVADARPDLEEEEDTGGEAAEAGDGAAIFEAGDSIELGE